ncbi:hypothetical protein R3P38DRAFT_3590762 [Favolaschia claudopus]|uniref:SH3 domain-containing protein n=1 Tax=Favolaschia claudopus TaxID=2862362 RepID=A0AAW0AGH1_9AGAR
MCANIFTYFSIFRHAGASANSPWHPTRSGRALDAESALEMQFLVKSVTNQHWIMFGSPFSLHLTLLAVPFELTLKRRSELASSNLGSKFQHRSCRFLGLSASTHSDLEASTLSTPCLLYDVCQNYVSSTNHALNEESIGVRGAQVSPSAPVQLIWLKFKQGREVLEIEDQEGKWWQAKKADGTLGRSTHLRTAPNSTKTVLTYIQTAMSYRRSKMASNSAPQLTSVVRFCR